MRLPLVVSVFIAVGVVPALKAAATKEPDNAVKPKVVATPPPKRGLLGRMFGSKSGPDKTKEKDKPATQPTPEPEPKPKARPRARTHKPEPEAEPTPKPEAEDKKPEKPDSDKPKPAPEPEAKPESEPPKPAGKTAKGSKGNKAAGKEASTKPPEPPKLDDATKYEKAHDAALADAQVKELKNKADTALDEDEAQKASVAYNKALFKKIRQIDPSIDGYVDKIEESMMKRLAEEKRDR